MKNFGILTSRLLRLEKYGSTRSTIPFRSSMPIHDCTVFCSTLATLLLPDGRPRRSAAGSSVQNPYGRHVALALVDAAGLSCGVTAEAILAAWWARPSVRRVMAREPAEDDEPLTVGRFATFYWPLALTALLSLAVHPVITFFAGRARLPVESLAVLPIVNSFSFLFRSMSLSLQELLLTLFGRNGEGRAALRIFVGRLALFIAVVYSSIAFTPLARIWLTYMSGLEPELVAVALLPMAILFIQPVTSVLLMFQTSTSIHARRTGPISRATVAEVIVIAAVLAVGVSMLDWTGAVAAAAALSLGRLVGAGYMTAANARAHVAVKAAALTAL